MRRKRLVAEGPRRRGEMLMVRLLMFDMAVNLLQLLEHVSALL